MKKKLKGHHFKTGFIVVSKFISDHKRGLVVILVLGVFSAIGNGAVPFITGKLFDSILNPDNTFSIFEFTLPFYMAILILLAAVQIIVTAIDYKAAILRPKYGFMARFDYQTKAFSRLLELPISFHKTKKVGEFRSVIEHAGIGMEVISERVLAELGPQFLTIFVAIFFLIKINFSLSIFVILGIATYVILSIVLIKDGAIHRYNLIKGYGISYGEVEDAIGNVTTVKQSATEKYEQKRILRTYYKNLFPHIMSLEKVWQSLNSSRGIIVVILQIIVFVWSIQLILTNEMTVGELIAFNSYMAIMFAPFTQLLNMWRMVQNGLLDISAVENMLSTKPENYHPNFSQPNLINGNIEFLNVHFSYNNKVEILKNISFKVSSGEVVALVGESGVGKSTLIDLISAYYHPNKGKVLIDGINTKRIDLKLLRSNIAIVPQEVSLFNDTIKTNIKYGNFKASQKEVEEAAKKSHALDFIQKFPKKWNQVVGERGVKLSVGQKQRVAIARAILRDPKILILDEPTSALDAKSEKIIQESLNTLMKGRTTFVIAHRLSTVRKADLILVIENGEIVERGRHEELIKIKDGKYRHLYELQIGLHN